MILPEYILFKHEHVYVCSTKEPHYIFRVVHKFTDYWVAGYNIYLTFNGTLAGNRILMGEDVDSRVVEALTWFSARVHGDSERYKKHKL